MRFTPVKVKGAFVIEPDTLTDKRGYFSRIWCQREWETQGLNPRLVQCSESFNRKKGTLRGMHYQAAPHEETKLVRCIAGSIFDAIIDLRPHSPTFRQHFSVVLSAENRAMLYVPAGCAHGFQTIEDNTVVLYQMSEFYCSECARGVRWNDPEFGLHWPEDDRTMVERDRDYPDFTVEAVMGPSICRAIG
jgi:dTDP-4-dehydrorhamnose 3,5-epimerase